MRSKGARKFRDLPIRQKLMVVIMLTTTVGMLISGAGIIFADSILFQRYLVRDLSTLCRIIADNSTAALEFNEPRSAEETLAALHEREHVVIACIFQDNGAVLATYQREGGKELCPAPQEKYAASWTSGSVTISQPILRSGRRIGTLVLQYDLKEIGERVTLYGTTVLGVLLISSLVAFLISAKLRSSIATPILQLASATETVSATKDYSIRAIRYSRDELGLLVDRFNEMLSGIQSRDADLIKALSERETALRAAQSTRDFLRTTLASIGDAVVSTDIDGHILFANPVALMLLQRTEAETIGKQVDDVFFTIDETTRLRVPSPVKRVLSGDSAVHLAEHNVLIANGGGEIPVDNSAAPILTQNGEVAGVVLIFRDITERRKAEQERQRLPRRCRPRKRGCGRRQSWKAWACWRVELHTILIICWWEF